MTPREIEKILDSLEPYEKELELVESRLSMRGKSLGEAQKEQAAWPIFYAVKRVELGTMSKRLSFRIAAIRGRLHQFLQSAESIASSERQIEKFIDANEEFLAANELFLHVEELYKKYNEILTNGFDKRGFALRDFTQARINDIHNEIL